MGEEECVVGDGGGYDATSIKHGQFSMYSHLLYYYRIILFHRTCEPSFSVGCAINIGCHSFVYQNNMHIFCYSFLQTTKPSLFSFCGNFWFGYFNIIPLLSSFTSLFFFLWLSLLLLLFKSNGIRIWIKYNTCCFLFFLFLFFFKSFCLPLLLLIFLWFHHSSQGVSSSLLRLFFGVVNDWVGFD